MKKVCVLVALLLVATMVLTGCADILFTTGEYRKYQYFAQHNREDMSKQQVLDRLGNPDFHRDAEGNAYRRYQDQEAYEQKLCSAESATWCYECYKHSDPAAPYRLWLSFDAQGKLAEVEFEMVYGG